MTKTLAYVKLPHMRALTKSVKFTIMLEPSELVMLRKLAVDDHTSMSETVRQMIHRAFVQVPEKRVRSA